MPSRLLPFCNRSLFRVYCPVALRHGEPALLRFGRAGGLRSLTLAALFLLGDDRAVALADGGPSALSALN